MQTEEEHAHEVAEEIDTFFRNAHAEKAAAHGENAKYALVFRLVAAPPGQRENVRAGAVRTQADRLLGIDSVH